MGFVVTIQSRGFVKFWLHRFVVTFLMTKFRRNKKLNYWLSCWRRFWRSAVLTNLCEDIFVTFLFFSFCSPIVG